MKKIITISAILLSLAFVFGSCASKRYTKKAAKLEAIGQNAEAAELYYQAVVAKKTNVEAISGLKRTGQITFNEKLGKFNQAYNNQNNKEAVYLYEDAKEYYDKVSGVGVSLNFPSFYKDYYEEVKNSFLEDQYYKGLKLLDEEKFAQAENVFKEIVRLQPNYKDAKDKLITATYEPKYRDGIRMMENDRHRQAYYMFEEIIEGAGAYKDSYALKDESLEKGSMTVIIESIQNNTSSSGIESTMESSLINKIKGFNNPFIVLIDSRSTTNGKNGGSGLSNITVNCEISKFTYSKGNLNKTEKKGYLKKKVKVLNRETEEYEYKTEYSKVVYYEYEMSRTIDMVYSFKIVSTRTGEILSTESKSLRVKDEIHYAKYDGNTKNLVPGYWKEKNKNHPDDRIDDNKTSIKKLNELLEARSVIKDYNTLSTEIINESADYISNEVNDFVNEN